MTPEDYIDTREGWREVAENSVLPDRTEMMIVGRYNELGHGSRWFVRGDRVPPLPTEPGYYVADRPSYGDTVVVELLHSPAGQWVDAGDREYLTADHVRALGELTKLEPRAVTAKAVLDRLTEEIDQDSVVTGGVYRKLTEEFGVVS